MVTGGNKLGDLTVGIRAPLGTLQGDLRKAETATTTAGGKMTGAMDDFHDSVEGVASELPILGGQLGALATPVGAMTVGFGALSAAVLSSVTQVISLERELRPMVQRSGLAAEKLQILTAVAERLGSEDGLEGVTDSVQELQLRVAEAASGSETMEKRFTALGLSSQALIAKSPEQMFLQVITAIQDLNTEAEKKFAADELLGGSSEKLAGIINLETKEFKALADEIARTHNIISQDALNSARDLDIEMTKLKETAGGLSTEIASVLIPGINNLIDGIKIASGDTLGGFQWLGQKAEDGLGMIVDEYNEGIAKLPWFSEINFTGFQTNMSDSGQAALDFGDDAETMNTDATLAFSGVETAIDDTGDASETFKTKSNAALNGEGGAGAGIKQFSSDGIAALGKLKEQWRINSEKETAGSMVHYASETTDGILGESERKLTQLEIYRKNLEAARKKHHEEVSLPNEKARAAAEVDEVTAAWQVVEKGFGSADDPQSHAGKMTELASAYYTKALGQVNKAYNVETGWYYDKHDKAWKKVRDELGDAEANTGHLGKITSSYEDAYDIIESDVTGSQDAIYDSLAGEDGYWKKLETETGIHLSNIQSMYATAGANVAGSWSAMMTSLSAQVDIFIARSATAAQSLPAMFQSAGALNPFSGPNAVQGTDASEATWQWYINGRWVDQDDVSEEELAAARATQGTVKSRRVHDTLGVVSSVGDTGTVYSQDVVNQWLYYLDRLAQAPITAGSPYALTRADLGLSPVGSTPPTLPGLPGFADGGIAMRPMAANIAESGPEAVIPLDRMQPTINVIVGEGAYVFDDFVDQVQDALHEIGRQGLR